MQSRSGRQRSTVGATPGRANGPAIGAAGLGVRHRRCAPRTGHPPPPTPGGAQRQAHGGPAPLRTTRPPPAPPPSQVSQLRLRAATLGPVLQDPPAAYDARQHWAAGPAGSKEKTASRGEGCIFFYTSPTQCVTRGALLKPCLRAQPRMTHGSAARVQKKTMFEFELTIPPKKLEISGPPG